MSILDFASQLFNNGTVWGSPSHQGAFNNRVDRSQDGGSKIQVGRVIQVFPDKYSCRIMTAKGIQDSSWLSSAPISPHSAGGDLNIPEVDAVCAFSSCYGMNMIHGYLPQATAVLDDDLDEGRGDLYAPVDLGPDNPPLASSQPRYRKKGTFSFEGLRPTGMVPGDLGFVAGRRGNAITATSSGDCMMSSGPMAQIWTSNILNGARINAENYTLQTAWGVVEHTATDKGANLRIRGAGRIIGGSADENYTVRGDLGRSGNLVSLRVTRENGTDLARLHANQLGDITTLAKKLTSTTLGNAIKRYRGAVTETIGKTYNQTVEGTVSKIWKGKVTQEYSSGLTRTIGGARIFAVMGEDSDYISKKRTTISEEGWKLITGAPSADDAAAGGGSDIILIAGDEGGGSINLESPMSGDITAFIMDGNFIVDTAEATDSVQLGKENPTNNAVKYDELKSAINTLAQKLDNHTHDLSIFAGPGSWTSQAPMTMSENAISNDVTNMKCGTVLIGD